MPRTLWPSSRLRGTLSGNGYRKEQLVRGQLWLTLGNNGIGQRLEESLPYPASRVSLGLEKTQLPLPCAQPQLVSLPAANWVQLCTSAGRPWKERTTVEQPHGTWPALLTPALPEQDWLALSWPGSRTSSAGGLSHGTALLYSSVRASPVLAELPHRQPNKLYQVQVSSCTHIFQYPDFLGFPHCLSFTSVTIKLNNGLLIGDRWIYPSISFGLLEGSANLLWSFYVQSCKYPHNSYLKLATQRNLVS